MVGDHEFVPPACLLRPHQPDHNRRSIRLSPLPETLRWSISEGIPQLVRKGQPLFPQFTSDYFDVVLPSVRASLTRSRADAILPTMQPLAKPKRKSGTTRPTIYDVARTAGVSTSTVSRSLNGTTRVADETQLRIAQAIAVHRYEVNSVARSLATSVTRSMALLLPDITNPFFPALVKGVQKLADERDFALLLCQTDSNPARELRYLDLIRRDQVAGVILIGVQLDSPTLELLARNRTKVVSLDRRVSLPGSVSVEVDNRQGAIMAVEHLTRLGHTRIACLLGPDGLYVSAQRLAGWRAGMRAAGLRPDPALIVRADFTEDAGARATEELLSTGAPFTAMVTANDLCALGAIAHLQNCHLTVPGDISVVGFDGIDIGRYTSPPLTTVAQPATEIGYRAAEILLDRVQDVDGPPPAPSVIFRPQLLVRGSTAAPPMAVRDLRL